MTMQEGTWQESVFRKYYSGRPDWRDGTTQFHQLVEQYAPRSARILEIGPGPTNRTSRFLASLGNVTGLDIDPIVQSNVHCQQAVVYDGVHIPLEDNSFDLAVSSFVSEHIENPIEVTREINRVLCPGGLYIFRTPNLWHYVSLIAKVTPQWFHTAIADRVRNRQGKHEPWPTYHRMNTRRACRNILKAAGFEIKVLKIIEPEPSYAMWSRAAFYPCDDVGEALELIASL